MVLARFYLAMQDIREAELLYCKNNIQYFIDTYGHIEDKDADELIQPFSMWKEQREALDSIMKHRLNVVLKARQLGISWLVMHIVAHLVLTDSGKTAICLSKNEEDAKELIRRVGVILRWCPELVAEKDHEPTNWDGPIFNATALTLTIRFPQGGESVVKGLPSSPGAGRSLTANLVVFDEWAFQQFAEEIWTAAFPVINRPTGGKVVGLSTIDRGSLFEKIFTDTDNGFNKVFIPWFADPRRDKEWYERTKRALGDLVTQEYPASIEEALLVPGGSYFPEVKRDIHETEELLTGKTNKYVSLDYGLDMLSVHWIEIDTNGNALVYRTYRAPNLTVSQACGAIQSISRDETIELYLAPPDLWNRRQETGKSVFDIFHEYGITLTKVSRDMFDGCISMKEWLKPVDGKPALRFLKGYCDSTINCLQKIQKDKNNPNVYAKTPHDLTHDVDSLRYFCVYWTRKPKTENKTVKKKWRKDLIEDYKRANKEIKALMIKNLGEPQL